MLEREANQPSRSRSLGPAARLDHGEQASVISGGEESSLKEKNLRILWRNGRFYRQMAPPILVGSGGLRRHRLVQLRCRPIGSFSTHCTNQ